MGMGDVGGEQKSGIRCRASTGVFWFGAFCRAGMMPPPNHASAPHRRSFLDDDGGGPIRFKNCSSLENNLFAGSPWSHHQQQQQSDEFNDLFFLAGCECAFIYCQPPLLSLANWNPSHMSMQSHTLLAFQNYAPTCKILIFLHPMCS